MMNALVARCLGNLTVIRRKAWSHAPSYHGYSHNFCGVGKKDVVVGARSVSTLTPLASAFNARQDKRFDLSFVGRNVVSVCFSQKNVDSG